MKQSKKMADKLKDRQKNKREAISFFESVRGQYIISQALWYAIKTLEKEKYPNKSDIKDMKYLMDEFFCMFSIAMKMKEMPEHKKYIKQRKTK